MANTLSCPVPDTLDPLSPNGFQLTIQKLPGVSFFCQEANLPGLTLPPLPVNNQWSTVPYPSNQLIYEPLHVRFMIDAKMNNYAGVLGWMEGLGFPESYDQYINFQKQQAQGSAPRVGEYDFSDGTLIVLGPNGRPVRTIDFIDMIPTHLSSLVFTTTANDVKYLIGDCVFSYNLFRMRD